eukprot:symbB.v1.2.008636.t1/scaffold540.1/size189765/1
MTRPSCHEDLSLRRSALIGDRDVTELLRSLPEVPKTNRLHLCFNEKFLPPWQAGTIPSINFSSIHLEEWMLLLGASQHRKRVLHFVHSAVVNGISKSQQEVGAAVGLLGDYLDLIVVPMVLQKPSLREEALQCPCKRCSNSLKAIHRLERPVLALLREASQCKDGLKCKLLLFLHSDAASRLLESMDQDQKLIIFLDSLGPDADIDFAKQILQAHEWDLQAALETVTGGVAAPSAEAMANEEVRAPIRTGYVDRLIDTSHEEDQAAVLAASESFAMETSARQDLEDALRASEEEFLRQADIQEQAALAAAMEASYVPVDASSPQPALASAIRGVDRS